MSDLDRTLQELKDIQASVRQGAGRVESAIDCMSEAVVEKLEEILVAVHEAPHRTAQGGRISAVHGRRCKTMGNVAVPKLLDTEKVELSIMPRKPDGHIDAAAGAAQSWKSSDTAQGDTVPGTEPFDFEDVRLDTDGVTELWREVVTCPGNFRAFATTPNESGTFTATSTIPGYEDEVFGPIEYAAGQPRKQNGSVGSPVSDLPV